MTRKPPRQNPVRDFVKQARKCGLEPFVVTATLPDGTVRTEMRATDPLTHQEPKDVNEWDNAL